MAFQLEDMQKAQLTAKGQSAAGNPTTDLQEPITWESSDPNIVAITNVVGLTAWAETVGPLGSATVTATGVNGSGNPISGQIVIDVVPGPTVAVLIEAGAPEPR